MNKIKLLNQGLKLKLERARARAKLTRGLRGDDMERLYVEGSILERTMAQSFVRECSRIKSLRDGVLLLKFRLRLIFSSRQLQKGTWLLQRSIFYLCWRQRVSREIYWPYILTSGKERQQCCYYLFMYSLTDGKDPSLARQQVMVAISCRGITCLSCAFLGLSPGPQTLKTFPLRLDFIFPRQQPEFSQKSLGVVETIQVVERVLEVLLAAIIAASCFANLRQYFGQRALRAEESLKTINCREVLSSTLRVKVCLTQGSLELVRNCCLEVKTCLETLLRGEKISMSTLECSKFVGC